MKKYYTIIHTYNGIELDWTEAEDIEQAEEELMVNLPQIILTEEEFVSLINKAQELLTK